MIKSGSSRSRKLIGNIAGSTVLKGVNVLITMLLVRYSIAFIGEEKYGVWLTLLSFLTWFSALEVGISSTLRNQLTRFLTENKNASILLIIQKAYKGLIIVYLSAILLLITGSIFLPLSTYFLPEGETYGGFNLIFQISITFYLLHYVLFFLNAVLLATHRATVTFLISAIQNGTLLIGIILFKYFDFSPTLGLICLWFSIVPFLVWLFTNFIAFNSFLSDFKPKIGSIIKEKSAPFKNVTPAFFVIQICTLIIFSTDNLIIINHLSGAEVSKYNIVFKYFNLLTVLFNIILIPYWASFTEAYHKKDKKWIQKNIRNLKRFLGVVTVIAIVLILLSTFAYEFWIGKKLYIPLSLTVTMCISVILTSWNNIFAYFLNSIDAVKLQMKIIVISACINIPLSFILVRYYESTGVIFATVAALLPLSIALPIQYKSILKKI